MTDIAIVRELLRRALLTLIVLPDPDIKYRLGLRSPWPHVVRSVLDAYGAAPPKAKLFDPTPLDISRYLDVLEWLRWYQQEYGSSTIRLLKALVRGKSKWELQQLCLTQNGQPARSRTTPYNRLNGMYQAIALEFKDDILLYRIDGLNELNDFDPNHSYGRDCAESDLADLPTSPKACISAIPEPLSPADEARAHKLLTKRMQRNHLAAMQRKRTKTPPRALLAAVRC